MKLVKENKWVMIASVRMVIMEYQVSKPAKIVCLNAKNALLQIRVQSAVIQTIDSSSFLIRGVFANQASTKIKAIQFVKIAIQNVPLVRTPTPVILVESRIIENKIQTQISVNVYLVIFRWKVLQNAENARIIVKLVLMQSLVRLAMPIKTE
jgi:hypothetical protein